MPSKTAANDKKLPDPSVGIVHHRVDVTPAVTEGRGGPATTVLTVTV